MKFLMILTWSFMTMTAQANVPFIYKDATHSKTAIASTLMGSRLEFSDAQQWLNKVQGRKDVVVRMSESPANQASENRMEIESISLVLLAKKKVLVNDAYEVTYYIDPANREYFPTTYDEPRTRYVDAIYKTVSTYKTVIKFKNSSIASIEIHKPFKTLGDLAVAFKSYATLYERFVNPNY